MSQNKQIVEINGVKLEIDLTEAKVINNYKIGDNIKVLIKDYSTYESHVGAIIGFDNFKNLPSINIAYVKTKYDSAEVRMITYNNESKDVEICPLSNPAEINFDKANITDLLQREILKKEEELAECKYKLKYFLTSFNKSFEKYKGEEK